MAKSEYLNELADRSLAKDHSRPFYKRNKGQIGIYISLYDAKPLDHTDYGSKHFYEQNLVEILFNEWKDTPLDLIKGKFERAGLLEDVVLEGFTAGIILSVTFNHPQSLKILCDLYNEERFEDYIISIFHKDEIQKILEDILITEQLLVKLSASSIQIRTKIWKDEYDDCLKELNSTSPRVPLKDMACCVGMLKKAKQEQNIIANKFLKYKDDLAVFEHHMNEYTVLIKNSIPINAQKIGSYGEFLGIVEQIRDKTTADKIKHLDAYVALRDDMDTIIEDFEIGICHPLAQVHPSVETPAQSELRTRIISRRGELQKRLELGYDLSRMSHAEARRRVLVREHGLFLGLVSIIYISLDLALEFDQQFDEYMSGYTAFPH